jgi:hypothetical protein
MVVLTQLRSTWPVCELYGEDVGAWVTVELAS